jgi:tetratricopeptide (TPR) repeat protein
LTVADRHGARGQAGQAHRILGQADQSSNPDQAAFHFQKSIAILQKVGAENELALSFASYGRFHKQQEDIDQAREFLTKALEIFERLGTLIEPDKVRRELAEITE